MRRFEVRRYSVGSLLQCGVSSRSESYQFFGQTAILVEFHGSLTSESLFWPVQFVLVVKTSNRPPEGLLQPLSVPSRPWSHIALDFVTALPASQGNTVVLTVVDRFSKAAHFIPLPKLPSAKETAVTIVDHVFRIHGLPMDVVSDRGPQFVSKFLERVLSSTGGEC